MGDSYSVPKAVGGIVAESHLKILAHLILTGVSNEDAAKQLNISAYQVRKIEETEEFKTAIRTAADEMVRVASHTWKGSITKLIPKALKALEKALDAGKVDAVKLVMASIGLDKVEQQASGGTLQVVLPDFTRKDNKDAIEVKSI